MSQPPRLSSSNSEESPTGVPGAAMDSEKMFQLRLSSALDLKKAIDRIKRLKAIGHCPELVKSFEDDNNGGYDPVESDDKQFTTLKKLVSVFKDFPVPNASGQFESPFNLRITRPGCEYDGPVTPNMPGSPIHKLISQWFENSAVSGYGDNRTLQTKIDDDVRSAREILPSEFSVEPELLELIKTTWAKHFIPGRVRAEPYKIHLYGPGGHFKSHCDTPEKGLVGTFLVGLGDTTIGKGNFHIGGERLYADPCHWVAFHPDVPHSVSKLKNNHRAVIAFKIFYEGADDGETMKLPPELIQRLKESLEQMKPPYGILLDHKYCMGTSEMSGFDSLLLSSARMMPGVDVHVLPVVTKFHGECDIMGDDDPDAECEVYPLTEDHVDILLKRNVEKAQESAKWLNGLPQDIPFYSLDFKSSAYTWRRDKTDGSEYTGNSSDPLREDSIYLSYAMLVVDPTDLGTSKDTPTDALASDASSDSE